MMTENAKYTYIDTHAHVYDEAFSGEEDEIVKKSREAGVRLIIQPERKGENVRPVQEAS